VCPWLRGCGCAWDVMRAWPGDSQLGSHEDFPCVLCIFPAACWQFANAACFSSVVQTIGSGCTVCELHATLGSQLSGQADLQGRSLVVMLLRSMDLLLDLSLIMHAMAFTHLVLSCECQLTLQLMHVRVMHLQLASRHAALRVGGPSP
jgi:hypothetical protein